MTSSKKILIILGLVFISFNLRAPITSVGSIVNLIQEDLQISSSIAGFITTLPLIAFAVFSPFVSKISNIYGPGLTMLSGLILIIIGEFTRSYTNLLGLFIGTSLIGIGISIGNVLIPSIIKLRFPGNVGIMSSVYTTSMGIFAAIGSGISVPLAKGLSLGWRNTLAVYIVLAVITIFVWLPQVNINKMSIKEISKEDISTPTPSRSIFKSKLAWSVTSFMGIQSLLYYSLVAWLPTIVMSKGMSPNFAGIMALLMQLASIVATLLIPIIADRYNDQRIITTISSSTYLVGIILLLFGNTQIIFILSIICIGLGVGGSISLAITFISLRCENAKRAAELSGMSQSVGYLFASFAPMLFGYIFDITLSWTIPLLLFIITNIFLIIFGLKAGKNQLIEE
ncbi:MAG: MFS transporter [Clostridium sp.]